MLKLVIVIDCNECGLPMNKAAACLLGKEDSWQGQINLLVQNAEQDGWRFWREYVICPECIVQELTMADYFAEPEEDDV